VWFIADGVSTALLSAFLASFAVETGAGPNKHIILCSTARAGMSPRIWRFRREGN
jgi:hypothetical protein